MTARKNVDILAGYSQREPSGKSKRVVLQIPALAREDPR